MRLPVGWISIGLLGAGVSSGWAQEAVPLKVGDPAPDFALQAASQGGVLKSPVRLSDLRDHPVVIAFFYQARTKG